jgi:hypothetical protein
VELHVVAQELERLVERREHAATSSDIAAIWSPLERSAASPAVPTSSTRPRLEHLVAREAVQRGQEAQRRLAQLGRARRR